MSSKCRDCFSCGVCPPTTDVMIGNFLIFIALLGLAFNFWWNVFQHEAIPVIRMCFLEDKIKTCSITIMNAGESTLRVSDLFFCKNVKSPSPVVSFSLTDTHIPSSAVKASNEVMSGSLHTSFKALCPEAQDSNLAERTPDKTIYVPRGSAVTLLEYKTSDIERYRIWNKKGNSVSLCFIQHRRLLGRKKHTVPLIPSD